MAGKSANAYVKINVLADSKAASLAFGNMGTAADRMASRFKTAGRAMTMGLTLPIVAGAALAVKAASDLNESINKTNVVFGKAAKSVHVWSRTSATAMGLSRQAAEENAATLGNLFATMNLGQKQSASMSKSMVELAADLASFNNIPIEEALVSLRSGLVGEAEPMRRLGVLLSEAAVRTEAYRLKLAKSGAELTEQQKVMARYSLILRQTKNAQGDFTRTSDGLANTTRILKAQFTDIAAKLGKELLPVVRQAAGKISGLVESFSSLSGGQRSAVIKVGLLVAAMGPLLWVTGQAITVVSALAKAYKAVALWAAAAGAAQRLSAGAGAAAAGASVAGGAAAGGGALAGGAGAASAGLIIPVAIVAIAAAASYALYKGAKYAQSEYEKSGKYPGGQPGNTFGRDNRPGGEFDLRTDKAQSAIAKALEKLNDLKQRLAEQMTLGNVDNGPVLRAIKIAKAQLYIYHGNVRERLVAGHINARYWTEAFSKAEGALSAFKSHVTIGLNTGRLNTSGWTDAMYRAYQIFLNIKAGMSAPISSHATVYQRTVKAHASGGIVTRPHIGLVGESGPEAIIPLTRPARAREVMQQAGLAGVGGMTVNVNVVVPGGTTLIGTAQEVGNILAPHVARALSRTAAQAGRRR